MPQVMPLWGGSHGGPGPQEGTNQLSWKYRLTGCSVEWMLSKIFFHSVISGTYIISRSFNSFSNTPLLFSQCHVLFFFLSFSTFHSLLSFENCHFLWHQVPGSTNPPVLPIHFHVGMHVFLSAAVVQSLSRVQLFSTPWTVAHQASLSFTISQSLS